MRSQVHAHLSWNFSGCWGETYHRIWKMMQDDAEQGQEDYGEDGVVQCLCVAGLLTSELRRCTVWKVHPVELFTRRLEEAWTVSLISAKSQSDRKRGDRSWGGGNHTNFTFEEGRLRNSLVIPGKISQKMYILRGFSWDLLVFMWSRTDLSCLLCGFWNSFEKERWR